MEPIDYKKAILDCWELIDPDPEAKKYPLWWNDSDILDNLDGLIKQLRGILEPAVKEIMKEGD